MDKPKLIVLSQQMYEHTKGECANCRSPHQCCNAMECGVTAQYALEDWGVTLEPTGHPTIPFMGPNGCVVPPHLRPICTVHTCDINGMGFKRGPGGMEWTKRYFELREQINEAL